MLCIRPLVVLVALAALSGCGGIPAPDVEPSGPPRRLAGTPSYDARQEPASAVLPFVPATATTLTVTDLDRIRAQLGVPDLTSDDLMADRSEFWSRAEREAPLLAQGMLRAAGSELMFDYGFTQDDVDWEAHFTGEDGNGFVLGFRNGVDMSEVARAVRDGVGPLGGAHVLAAEHLVVAGGARNSAQSWATDPAMVDLVGTPAEATYARRGCLPLVDALGPEVTAREQRRVLARHDVTALDPLAGFALEFGDHLATVRMDPELGDLFARLHLGDDWPAAGSPDFEAGYAGAVGDPTTGRIGYDVADPPLAARIALLETLPFGVCNEVTPIPEPAG